MSKRKRVPAPFSRILPNVIRTFGPRLVLIGGGVVVLLILCTGGSYLLSRISAPPKTPAHKTLKKIAATSLPKAQVLGDATNTSSASAGQGTASRSGNTPVPRTGAGTHAALAAASSPDPSDSGRSAHGETAAAGGTSSAPQGTDAGSQGAQGTSVSASTPLGTLTLHLPGL